MDRTVRFDEDPTLQYGMSEYLMKEGADVPGTGLGPGPEVRILRLVMTPTVGRELLRRLRSEPLASDTPIVVLTH